MRAHRRDRISRSEDGVSIYVEADQWFKAKYGAKHGSVRFEKIDEIQNEAIKLMLKREKDETDRIPATASGSRLSGNHVSQRPGIGAIRIVRSIEGWHTHMWHSDVEERSWTG
jgi:hypothetical protein